MSRSALGADSSYDGGQPTHAKDLKGKKIVLADGPKLIGIGYFAATTKGEAEAATELTKNGLPTEVTTDAPTEAAIQKQIEYIDNDISRGMDGILFAANDLSAISPVLRKALKAGVHVIGYDAESPARCARVVYSAGDARGNRQSPNRSLAVSSRAGLRPGGQRLRVVR